ncbi:MAG TPA: hypothetical protein VGO61_07790 [Steroidobacteraceae bacterium]|jgi:hypothetical protein|nr:hypothetical protein [Steroidobacteraceae bacterium]
MKEEVQVVPFAEKRGRPTGPEIRLMVFQSRGRYPRGTQRLPGAVFHADEKIVFSVVRGDSWHALDPDIPFSEFDWASPNELRLLAALMLCEQLDECRMTLYPIVRFAPFLESEFPIESDEFIAAVRDRLLREVLTPSGFLDSYQSSLQCCAAPYDLVDAENFDFSRLAEFWRSLETPNYVLMRGMYALMKADMLMNHYEFCEEAVNSCFIALDASFSLVLRQLRTEGNANPSSHDAAQWVHRTFDQAFGLPTPAVTEKYFEEFYNQRVMTLHPASRLGDVPYSPNMHDDYCHLRPAIRQLLAFLLSGRHERAYLEAVASRAGIKRPSERVDPNVD